MATTETRFSLVTQGCHWSGESQGNSRSGKSQGILKTYTSGNPVVVIRVERPFGFYKNLQTHIIIKSKECSTIGNYGLFGYSRPYISNDQLYNLSYVPRFTFTWHGLLASKTIVSTYHTVQISYGTDIIRYRYHTVQISYGTDMVSEGQMGGFKIPFWNFKGKMYLCPYIDTE